jgi:thioredoxin 1
MSEVILDSGNFNAEVKKSDIPVMVDFYADWCGPCRMMSPSIEQLANEYSGKIKVCKLNVDHAQDIAGEYGVQSIPTVIFFKEGRQVDQFTGAIPKSNIENYIKKYI